MIKYIFKLIISIATTVFILSINYTVLASNQVTELSDRPTILSDLIITRADSFEGNLNQPMVGDIYTYTLTVTNYGEEKATQVLLKEDFGGWGITVEQITINHIQGTISFERGREKNIAIIHLGELLPKQQAEVNFIVRANGVRKDTIESIVTSKESPLPRSLFTKIVTKPKPVDPYDIEIIQSVDNHQPVVGEIINIIVYLANKGLGTASSVVVHLSLPKQLEVIEIEPQFSLYNTQENTWNLPVVADNLSRSLRIKAKVTEAATFSTIAEVVSADFQDLDSIANNGKNNEDDYSSLTISSQNR